jgi:hypothetical protein
MNLEEALEEISWLEWIIEYLSDTIGPASYDVLREAEEYADEMMGRHGNGD